MRVILPIVRMIRIKMEPKMKMLLSVCVEGGVLICIIVEALAIFLLSDAEFVDDELLEGKSLR